MRSFSDLITPHEETRAGFISLALEKNRFATPYVQKAKVLRVLASRVETPKQLLQMGEIQDSLLTAAGLSDKAKNYLHEADKRKAINGLIENFLEPSGKSFVDELVYRFLLTRGDSLGGNMRNLGGKLGEWRFTRDFISTCSIIGVEIEYLDSKSKKWRPPNSEPEIEKQLKGLHWKRHGNERTLIYNLTVPTVQKNVDLCLFDCSPNQIMFGQNKDSAHHQPEKYLALGELKGGIDPAGADEHWKTANSALDRIRMAFSEVHCHPKTFFIGAAIAQAMAREIHGQLNNSTLSNAANLTNQNQVVSLCDWLINI